MSLKNYTFLDSDNVSALIPLLDARYSIGQASNIKFGLIKLYDGTGDNIDGTMTQQAISQRLSSIYRFKGSLEDYEDLPKNPQIGDVYNIANPNLANHIKAGDNLAWNGTGWDNLSGLMDLSNYLQKNGEYIKSVSFNEELKTITFLLPDDSTESIILPSGLGSENLEFQDLNLLLEVGVYPINNLSGISNLPIQELGSLLVFSDKIYTHQLYYTLSGNFFVRVYNHSLQVWTEWSNIKTKLKQIYAETNDLSNPNFNDISLAICSIENITSASNYPIAKKGLLQNVIGNLYSFQIYTTIDGQVFNRCKTNNTWSSWKEISPTIIMITSGNLNNFTEYKTYHITDINNIILNKPDSSQSAEFIVTSSEGYIYQKYINSSNTIYIRNKKITDTNFSAWKGIIDSNSINTYAPLNSPTFTGNAIYNETIIKTDNSKKLANTEFVKNNLADYAPLNSAGLTGTPTLSTELSKSDNSKKIANTEFVNNYVTDILKSYALLASPSLTGNPTAPTQEVSNSSTRIATTAYVKNNLSSYALLTSPTFTGSPKAPTQEITDNSTNIATTKYVNDLISNILESYATLDSPTLTGNAILNVSLTKADNSKKIANTEFVKNNLADYMLSSSIQSTYAPLASPTFTGEPKSVTPLTTDNSTKIATTAYVNNLATNKLASYAPLASPDFSGTPKSPDVTAGDSTTKIANTKFVGTAISNALASYAPLNSPNLSGTPTTPDITAGTSTGQIANTKFVMTAIANLIDSAPESLNTLSELSSALNNDPSFATNVMTAIGEKLPIAGGEITGNLKVNGTITGTLSGNASSASKLNPGKTIQTNLASTTSSTFTGETNITPGVTGILGIANGGTGNKNGTVAQLTNARNLTTDLTSTTAGSFDGTANVSIGISGTLPEGHGGTGATSLANITVGKATYDTNGKKISEHTVEYIEGTQTAATGAWTGVTKDSALYEGKMIIYKLPYAGSGNATLNLTLSGGGTTGAKAIYRFAGTRLTTQYGANYYIPLVYNGSYWFVFADYDSTVYDRIRSANAIAIAEGAIEASKFIGTLDGTNYKEIDSGITFDIRYPILYNITAVADNANMSTGIYWVSQSQNMQTIIGDTTRTFTDKSQVFIKGTLSGNIFTVHSDILTTTVPTNDDGYYYLYVGRTYSTYQMNVNVLYNQLWKYSNGIFQPIDRYALMALQDSRGQQIDSTYIKGLSVSGKVITYTKGNGTTGTLTTQDTANTDENVIQKVSSTNATYPVLIAATADATSNISATNVLFGTGVKINPSTSTIYATTFSGNATSATKATNDSDNNQINTTYATKEELTAGLNNKLDSIKNGEFNKFISVPSTGNYVIIGEFACYDSMIAVDINVTSSVNYHCTAVLATQNVASGSTTSGTRDWSTYGDSSNYITPKLYLEQTNKGTIRIYYKADPYAKVNVKILYYPVRATPTEIVTLGDSSSIPSTATMQPVNTLITNFSNREAITGLSVSGTTITYTRSNGTTGTITTQDNNTHYTSKLIAGISTSTGNATSTNGNTYLRLFDDSTNRSSINIKGTGATSVTSDANGVITINSTNTTYNTGNTSTAGITKLYTGTGTNTDGTMTQSAIKSALEGKMSSSTAVNNVTQTVSTTNATYPLLAVATANQTATATAGAIFATGIKLNPSTGNISATSFTGNLTGNVTGNVSGSSGSCTGNAATATKATGDKNGADITTTYETKANAITGLSVSENILTYTKGGGNTGTVTIDKANALTTGRALQVSLSSAGAPTFNGNADVKNIGVTGVLPIANGGTGTSSGLPITNVIATGETSGNIDAITAFRVGSTASNKTFNISASAIKVEYSRDRGATWTDYGLTDTEKKNLFSETRITNVYLGKATAKADNNVKNMLRITINPNDRYVSVNMFYLWGSTNGNTWFASLDVQTWANHDTDTWTNLFKDRQMGGWSGNNVVYFNQVNGFNRSDSQGGNMYALRFTFHQTAINANYASASFNDIRCYGLNWWSASNDIVKSNRLYHWDANLNATFPANITATSFTGNLTGNVTGNCSGTSSNVTGTVAIANGGTGATTVAKAREGLFGTAMNTSALAKYVITINDSWASGGYTTVQQLRNFMGLGDTTGVLPIANGGTGQSSLDSVTVGVSKKVQLADLTGTNSADLVYAKMADNDYFRIRVGGTASNSGYAELATADDGNEPIYVRQYSGVFSTLTRTATLLDNSGNTSFPGTVTAPNFTGLATRATGDKNGADITTTYETKANAVTGLSLSGTTLTVTKGNSTTSTISLPSGGNYYGICSTDADTVAKTVSITGFTLSTGAKATIKFSVTNIAENPTLNITSTGAKAIYYRGYPIPAEVLQANSTYDLVYNGTEYEIIGSIIWTE